MDQSDSISVKAVEEMKKTKKVDEAIRFLEDIIRVSVVFDGTEQFEIKSNNKDILKIATELTELIFAPKFSSECYSGYSIHADKKNVTWKLNERSSRVVKGLYAEELDELLKTYDVKSDKGACLTLKCPTVKVSKVHPVVKHLYDSSEKYEKKYTEKVLNRKMAKQFCERSRKNSYVWYDDKLKKLLIYGENEECVSKVNDEWMTFQTLYGKSEKVEPEQQIHKTSSEEKNKSVQSIEKNEQPDQANQTQANQNTEGATGVTTYEPRAEIPESKGVSFSKPSMNKIAREERSSINSFRDIIVSKPSTKDSTYVFSVGSMRVLVYKQSITDIRGMDAIVNAANEHLNHAGGIAGYISKAAGRAMDDECESYIRKKGVVAVSEVFVSAPGRMSCKGIIHAVGPRWSDYRGSEHKCAEDLYKTILSCLATMKERNWKKIALCAISSGIFGVPKRLCTAMYMKAIEDFGRTSSNYTLEVHFIDVIDEILELMKTAHQNRLQSGCAEEFSVAYMYTYTRDGKGGRAAHKSTQNETMPGDLSPPGRGWKEYKPEKLKAITIDVDKIGKVQRHHSKQKSVQKLPNIEDIKEGKCVYDGKKATKKLSCGHIYCSSCFIQAEKVCRKCEREGHLAHGSDEVMENQVEENRSCPICMEVMSEEVILNCNHGVCKECLKQLAARKPACPVCGVLFGVETGTQPDGRMFTRTTQSSLPGYHGEGTIEICYIFPTGFQKSCHPNPRQKYEGIKRTAYLPNNTEGKEVLALLQKAFSRRLIFTIGDSRTTGKTGQITWNDIHHKTSPDRGQFSYPDDTYLTRVKEELAAKGITSGESVWYA